MTGLPVEWPLIPTCDSPHNSARRKGGDLVEMLVQEARGRVRADRQEPVPELGSEHVATVGIHPSVRILPDHLVIAPHDDTPGILE